MRNTCNMSMYLVRVPFSLCAVLLQDRLTPSPPPRRPPLPFQYNLYMPSWAIGECIHSPISIHRQRFCKHCTPPWTIIGLKMDSILLAFINSNISSSESNNFPNIQIHIYIRRRKGFCVLFLQNFITISKRYISFQEKVFFAKSLCSALNWEAIDAHQWSRFFSIQCVWNVQFVFVLYQ